MGAMQQMLVAAGGGVADPNFASLVSGLHFDGADASTTFTDVKGKTWTAQGNAQLDTAQTVFGPSSGLFDGTGDYVSTPHSADFNFTGSFCVRGWIRPTTVATIRAIASHRDSSGQNGWVFWVRDTAKLGFAYGNGATQWVDAIGSTSIVANVWTYVEAGFDGTNLKLFVGGVQDFSTSTFSGTRTDSSGAAYIGRDRVSNTTRDFNGHIDDLQIYKGYSGHTSGYTVPTAAFPNF